MTHIELSERNILWLARQGVLKATTDNRDGIRHAEQQAYITLERRYYGLTINTEYVLTCAGAARLAELNNDKE